MPVALFAIHPALLHVVGDEPKYCLAKFRRNEAGTKTRLARLAVMVGKHHALRLARLAGCLKCLGHVILQMGGFTRVYGDDRASVLALAGVGR